MSEEELHDPNESTNIQGYSSSPYADLNRMVDEQQELAEGGAEAELVQILDANNIPVEDKLGLLAALKDTALVETQEGRDKIKSLMNAEDLTKEQIEKLISSGAKDKLNEIIAIRLREAIHNILPVEALRADNISVIPELSDSLPIDPLHEIKTIIDDADVSANQGMMQNVLISEQSDYVLKILKTDLQDKEYARETLAHFEKAKEAFGKEFFPGQIGFEIKDPPRVGTLQEKVQLGSFNVLNLNSNIEELGAALTNEQNTAKLQTFLGGFDRLSTQGLTLDLGGDNVLWRLDENGGLEIKIVDSGLFVSEYTGENNQSNIARVNEFVNKLKQLVV